MKKRQLTKLNLSYPRTIVYMLQASEYKFRDYFYWYFKVEDFRNVEYRKRLKKTTKSLSLLIFAWLIVISFGMVGIFALYTRPDIYGAMLFSLFVFCGFYLLAYIIMLPFLMINILQYPVEIWITRNARRTLEKHKALKIAVAGSFGKTTMREILKTVFSEERKTAAPPFSYNTPLGISKFVKSLKGDEEILLFELGEYYPGDVKRLCQLIQPDAGVITGVNEAHLEKFKSLKKTTATIFELADCLEGKTVYVNGENDLARQKVSPDHILYTRQGVGGWKITHTISNLSGTRFTIRKGDVILNLESGLLGIHQTGPLSMAAHMAFSLGITEEGIIRGIKKTKPFPHRLEPKTENTGVTLIDDSYNGNPDGFFVAIDFLMNLTGYRRFYLTPGLVEIGEKTKEIHEEIGQKLANSGVEKVILIKNSVTGYIAEGLERADFKGDLLWFDDALSAFGALPYLTAEGDVVLMQNDWPDRYN